MLLLYAHKYPDIQERSTCHPFVDSQVNHVVQYLDNFRRSTEYDNLFYIKAIGTDLEDAQQLRLLFNQTLAIAGTPPSVGTEFVLIALARKAVGIHWNYAPPAEWPLPQALTVKVQFLNSHPEPSDARPALETMGPLVRFLPAEDIEKGLFGLMQANWPVFHYERGGIVVSLISPKVCYQLSQIHAHAEAITLAPDPKTP